jgi:hypothetical protein
MIGYDELFKKYNRKIIWKNTIKKYFPSLCSRKRAQKANGSL